MNNFNETNMSVISGLGVVLACMITIYMSSTDTHSMAKIRVLEERIEEEIADYNVLVDKHNELAEAKEKIDKENAQNIEDYNALVDRHNALLEDNTQLEDQIETLESRVSVLESRIRRNFTYKS